MIYVGYLGFLITLIGLGSRYLAEKPYTPELWLLVTLGVIGFLGIVITIKKKSATGFIGMLVGSLTWMAIHFFYKDLLKAYEVIQSSLEMNYNPQTATRYTEYLILFIGLMVFIAAWRANINYIKASVIDEEGINFAELGFKGTIEYIIAKLTGKSPEVENRLPNIEIGTDVETKQKVEIDGWHRYEGLLIAGAPGVGKTSRGIAPIIRQDLEFMADRMEKRLKKLAPGEVPDNFVCAITVQEPKGDLIYWVHDMAKQFGLDQMGVPINIIDPNSPNSGVFNVLQGEEEVTAEATTTVMKNIFGRQDAFFSKVQQVMCRNTIKLIKRLNGDEIDLPKVGRILRDPVQLENYVAYLQDIEGNSDLVQFFKKEYLTSKEKKSSLHDFAIGLRMQMEDLLSSERLKQLISGNSTIRLDQHLLKGGILLVNTDSLGKLGDVGDSFGQFFTMHYKGALFRRPGNQKTRIPATYNIDEAHRYMAGVGFDTFTSVGRSYNNAATMIIQSKGQFEMAGQPKGFEDVMLSTFRNLMVFSVGAADAEKFSKEFGDKEVVDKQATYDHKVVTPVFFPKTMRHTKKREPRFYPVEIMELPDNYFIYKSRVEGKVLGPGIAVGSLPKPIKQKEIIRKEVKDKETEPNKKKGETSSQTRSLTQKITPIIPEETIKGKLVDGTENIEKKLDALPVEKPVEKKKVKKPSSKAPAKAPVNKPKVAGKPKEKEADKPNKEKFKLVVDNSDRKNEPTQEGIKQDRKTEHKTEHNEIKKEGADRKIETIWAEENKDVFQDSFWLQKDKPSSNEKFKK